MKSLCNFLLWFVMVFKCIYSAPYGGGIFTRQHDAVVVDAPSFPQDDGSYPNEQVHNPVFCRHQAQYSPSSSGSELQTRRKYPSHQSTYHRNTPVQTYMPYTGAVRIRSYYTSPSTTNTYRTHSVDPSPSYYQRQTYNNVQESRIPPMATPYFPRKALPADENRDLASSYFVPKQTNDVMKIRDVAPASSYFVQRQNNVQDNIATSYSQPQNNAVQEDVAPAKCSSCYDVNSNYQENRDLTVAPASSYFSQQTSTVQENRDVAPASSYSLQQTSTVTENKNVARTPSYFQRSNVQENGDDFGPNSPTGSSYEAFMVHQVSPQYPTARVVMGYRLPTPISNSQETQQPAKQTEETEQPLRSSYN